MLTIPLEEVTAMRLPYRVSVLSESEAEISPFLHHLVQVLLQRVFFTGHSSNLFQSIAKLNKSFSTMSCVYLTKNQDLFPLYVVFLIF